MKEISNRLLFAVILLFCGCETLHHASDSESPDEAIIRLEKEFEKGKGYFTWEFWQFSGELGKKHGTKLIAPIMERSKKWKGEEGLIYVPVLALLPRQETLKVFEEYKKDEKFKLWIHEFLVEFDASDVKEGVSKYRGKIDRTDTAKQVGRKKEVDKNKGGDGSPRSLLDKSVTFEFPKNWILQKNFKQQKAEVLQLFVPYPETDDTPDSANAGLTAEPAQEGFDVKNFGDFKLQNKYEGTAILTDITSDDGKWRTVLWRSRQDKTPYVILDRFGVDKGVMVHFMLSFPVLEKGNGKWISQTLSEFNSIVKSLKIKGVNSVNSEAKYDHDMIWLRDFKDPTQKLDPSKMIYRMPADELKGK